MTQIPVSTSNEQSIHAALELSKNSWLLAIQAPGRDNPSLHPIKGGNAEGLMAKLDAARDRVAQLTGQTPKVTLCYEAGYDGFWLSRFLEQRGIECRVMEPASLQVSRNGAAGYKVMRSPRTRHGHHRWTRSTHTSCGKGRNHHATVNKTTLTSIGSYKETSSGPKMRSALPPGTDISVASADFRV